MPTEREAPEQEQRAGHEVAKPEGDLQPGRVVLVSDEEAERTTDPVVIRKRDPKSRLGDRQRYAVVNVMGRGGQPAGAFQERKPRRNGKRHAQSHPPADQEQNSCGRGNDQEVNEAFCNHGVADTPPRGPSSEWLEVEPPLGSV